MVIDDQVDDALEAAGHGQKPHLEGKELGQSQGASLGEVSATKPRAGRPTRQCEVMRGSTKAHQTVRGDDGGVLG